MKRNWISVALATMCLLAFMAGAILGPKLSLKAVSADQFQSASDETIKRDLVFFGPAKEGMARAGFNPTGSIKVFPTAEDDGTDKMKIEVEGLPGNTDFTVFLHELSDIPFGASEYIAEMHTDKKGRASVTIRTLIIEAFSLRTAGNPPTIRLLDVDLNFVAIWFADPKDSAAFTNIPTLAFDGDRSSGPVVLGTTDPLP